MTRRGPRRRRVRALLRTALKLVAGLVVAYVLVGLLLFWPILFHDDEAVRDADLDAMLRALELGRSDVSIARSYQAPPNWAGDSTRALCLALSAPPAIDGFVPGPALPRETAAALRDRADAARHELGWLPASPALISDRFLVRMLHTGSTSMQVAWIEPTGDAACFLGIRF